MTGLVRVKRVRCTDLAPIQYVCYELFTISLGDAISPCERQRLSERADTIQA